MWIRGQGKVLGGLCQVTGVTTHPADNCGVIGSKLRPTYLKHGAKSFQLANPTSGLVTYTLSLVGWDGMGYKLAGTGVATAQKFVQRISWTGVRPVDLPWDPNE